MPTPRRFILKLRRCHNSLTLGGLVRGKRHGGGDESKEGNDLEGLHRVVLFTGYFYKKQCVKSIAISTVRTLRIGVRNMIVVLDMRVFYDNHLLRSLLQLPGSDENVRVRLSCVTPVHQSVELRINGRCASPEGRGVSQLKIPGDTDGV